MSTLLYINVQPKYRLACILNKVIQHAYLIVAHTHRIVELVKLSIPSKDKPLMSSNADHHFVYLEEHDLVQFEIHTANAANVTMLWHCNDDTAHKTVSKEC